jgi:hypothetical protein
MHIYFGLAGLDVSCWVSKLVTVSSALKPMKDQSILVSVTIKKMEVPTKLCSCPKKILMVKHSKHCY